MTATKAPTVSVELTSEEILDLSVATAFIAERDPNTADRARYQALMVKMIRAYADSDLPAPGKKG